MSYKSSKSIVKSLSSLMKAVKAKRIRSAFTLAEVLITLGIIGVVAALTLPNLIANHKALQAQSRLKKSLSTLSQALGLAKAKYDYDIANVYGGNSALFSSLPCEDPSTDTLENQQTVCGFINSTLSNPQYLGDLTFSADTVDLNGYVVRGDVASCSHCTTTFYTYQLADGTIVGIGSPTETTGIAAGKSRVGVPYTEYTDADFGIYGFVDINGLSAPNTITECADGNLGATTCKVNKGDVKDMYDIIFRPNSVEPDSAATNTVNLGAW